MALDARTETPARIFLAGDVMIGRGIDQILPFPVDPRIDEPWVKDARDYVALAERQSGSIARGVPFEHLWGDLLGALERARPEARIACLETSVTRRGIPWPAKAVRYRVSPENAACLGAIGLDVCALANNHVLDYGDEGLADTLRTLREAGLAFAGAGANLEQARRPARIDLAGGGHLAVVSVAADDCGVPRSWAARGDRLGVALLEGERDLDELCVRIGELDRQGALVIVSIHWGSNWGYAVPNEHRELARRMIEAGADVVHGHSSHHPRPIEVHRERLVLYGCGDLIDDYEGIQSPEHDRYRGEIALGYLAELERRTGALRGLEMIPLRIRRMRLEHADVADVAWVRDALDRACATTCTSVTLHGDRLALRWPRAPASRDRTRP